MENSDYLQKTLNDMNNLCKISESYNNIRNHSPSDTTALPKDLNAHE